MLSPEIEYKVHHRIELPLSTWESITIYDPYGVLNVFHKQLIGSFLCYDLICSYPACVAVTNSPYSASISIAPDLTTFGLPD